ncbi:tetratricopeptide repeat protein [Scytonema sp. PCC 10023]|uniref:tetratricopeptide repeat protein n=1 Tax=Scytonema sp. PCC 10023 TaxID=1680591 RepID=UPI0039C6D2E6
MSQNIHSRAQKAETLRLTGAYEEAIKVFEELQKENRNSAWNAWVNAHLGVTYYQIMDYEKARQYLEKAIAQNDGYLWAHAQLGETYRMLAIVDRRNKDEIENAIKHFLKAIGSDLENSDYAWALAHLGATYRLEMTREPNIYDDKIEIDQNSKENALKCLSRAIELIPTYAWAWGMRASVYRLAQEYEDSYWDLEVETVIAPDIEVLQTSRSPVPLLVSKRLNLHEHALLSLYLTKEGYQEGRVVKEKQKEERIKHCRRGIAYAQKALIVQPGDLIAKLILLVAKVKLEKEEAEQKKDLNDTTPEELDKEISRLLNDLKLVFPEQCKTVLHYLIKAGQICFEKCLYDEESLKEFSDKISEEHPIKQLVLNDLLQDPTLREDFQSNPDEKAKLWIWQNFALTESCSHVLFLLADLSYLTKLPKLGDSEYYRWLANLINRYFNFERTLQTPALPNDRRCELLRNFKSSWEKSINS